MWFLWSFRKKDRPFFLNRLAQNHVNLALAAHVPSKLLAQAPPLTIALSHRTH